MSTQIIRTTNWKAFNFFLKRNPIVKKKSLPEIKAFKIKRIISFLNRKNSAKGDKIISNAKKFDIKHTHHIYYKSTYTLHNLMLAIRTDNKTMIKKAINERINLRAGYNI
jgi:hypothetical protein